MKQPSNESFKPLKEVYVGEANALQKLETLNDFVREKRKTFMGYPCNESFKLEGFFKWWEQSSLSKSPLNDVGDPYTDALYALNTHAFEREALHFFADLYKIDSAWGYITSGGTQGNEQGLYIGRQVLAQDNNPPILYFSEEAHYSIASLGKLLNLECRVIRSQITGEMDYEDLNSRLDANRPALFSLSIGTTFKGAIDRLEVIQRLVKKKGIAKVYYHADAALFGGYFPFCPDLKERELNFQACAYDSIAVSGHKFFGSPVPLGIFLTRKEHAQALNAEYIEYIDSRNMTIPCSRSSLNTLIFWWIITTTPIEEFEKDTTTIMENAHYLYERLKARHYPVWLNPHSNTLYFEAPSYALCKRWSLSLTTCRSLGHLAHIIVMQHVTKEMINQFLNELDEDNPHLSMRLLEKAS